MQKQYEDQLQAVQQEWYQLQQQQQEQQQILHQLLAKQQERLEHQQRALDRKGEKAKDDDARTPTGMVICCGRHWWCQKALFRKRQQ